MKNGNKLYMIMLGCRPEGRYTEQHDIFLGIGSSLKEMIPHIRRFWPEAKGRIHIDVWREVTSVDNYSITIESKGSLKIQAEHLFFINLGGYKKNEFDEYHYKMLAVEETMGAASKKAKETTFYKQYGFEGAVSHIDDKFGIDVDDVFDVNDILSTTFTEHFEIRITKSETQLPEDTLHIGYLKLEKIE